jgi:hypothetical protein
MAETTEYPGPRQLVREGGVCDDGRRDPPAARDNDDEREGAEDDQRDVFLDEEEETDEETDETEAADGHADESGTRTERRSGRTLTRAGRGTALPELAPEMWRELVRLCIEHWQHIHDHNGKRK